MVPSVVAELPPPDNMEGEEDEGLPEVAREVLKAVAKSMWAAEEGEEEEECRVRKLKGAMTNEVYECSWGDEEEAEGGGGGEGNGGRWWWRRRRCSSSSSSRRKVVLVRVYGEGVDMFFDRKDEIRTFEAMSRAGHGPRLLARFPNGRVEEFLHARTLTAADIRDPAISAKVAARLRDFHRLSLPGPKETRLWLRLRDWLQKAKALCRHEEAEEFGLEGLGEEIEELRLRLESSEKTELGFCHNDLQYGNIMMDEEDGSITIIDYEYATYNPVAYDIANHFCEMAANYHTDTPHLLDYSKYPGLEERLRFITAYLASSGDYKGGDCSLTVEDLAREAEIYTLASHMHWGLWGIISASVNDIDFDYLEYARQRFAQYHATKIVLLGIP